MTEKYKYLIEGFRNNYLHTQKPQEVSFRDIVTNIKPERATHMIHTYPAKLLTHIPYFFLNNNYFTKVGDVVLDPFCGSGTILLESIIAKRFALGVDSNPLARLISQVKTSRYSINILKQYKRKLGSYIPTKGKSIIPEVHNLDYWFLPNVKKDLSRILFGIKKIKNSKYRNFFLVCFSNCLRKVSLVDPKISVPVRINPNNYSIKHPLRKKYLNYIESLKKVNVFEKFYKVVDDNIQRETALLKLIGKKYTSELLSSDARDLSFEFKKRKERLKSNSVDLVFFSPPYAGAQKYIRSTKLSLGWLELAKINDLKHLENKSIGRESYPKVDYKDFIETGIAEADKLLKKIHKINPLRSHISAKYINEMREVFQESIRVLKRKGYLIVVIGNNQICGYEFKTHEYLTEIIRECGLETVFTLIDDIKSYGLMTKRNKNAGIISREWVLVFRKK